MINRDIQLCMSLADRPDNLGTCLHNYLHEKLGLSLIYKAFTTQDIGAAVEGARTPGIRGCAVSIPPKESYIPSLDAIDPSAKVIDSIDTIASDNGTLTGFNADHIAIKSLIISHQLDNHARVMIHNNGGMGKATIAVFYDTGFRDVIIATCNRENGLTLAKQYGFQQQPQPEEIACDVLVNMTSVDMAGGKESDELAYSEAMVAATSVVFDIVALSLETSVIKLAQQLGKKTINGAEVIILQAIEQFAMYTGVRPDGKLIAEAAGFAWTGQESRNGAPGVDALSALGTMQ